MELQEVNGGQNKTHDENEAAAGEATPPSQSLKFTKESNFRKFFVLICSWEFMFEFVILAVHPLPYYDVQYDVPILNMLGDKSEYQPVRYMLSDFLFAFMFLRVYFVIRTLMNFTSFSEMHSKRICAKYGVEANTSFCVKALMKKNAGMTILLTSIISIMWLSYLLRIFER